MTNQEARGILIGLEAAYRDLDPLAFTDDGIQLLNERIEAVEVAISALEKQDVPDANVGDMVSKKAVELALLEKGQSSKRYKIGEICELNFDEIREALATVPLAQPERKKGYWLHEKIISSNSERGFFLLSECTCSECNIVIAHEANYCPNCGADMRGEENG